MATKKVGIYRNYYGPIPTDKSGQPLSQNEWPKKRLHSWVVRWFGQDGNRYSKSFSSRKEAERFSESKQSDVRDGKADPSPEVTLREFCKEHLMLMKGNLAPATLRLHSVAMSLLAESVGWDKPLNSITLRDVERFRATRLETKISASSANRELRTLKRIFNLAVARGYLSGSNPCSRVPMIKIGRKRPAYCSPEEFQLLLTACKDSLWKAFLVVVYTTGLRLEEALNLTWADIDFDTGQLHVARKSAGELIQAWTPKDHELRIIPMPKQAINTLTAWQSVAPEKCPYVFMESGRWNFYQSQVSANRWRAGQDLVNNMLRKFKTICRRVGVGPYAIHDMRRSCITNWAKMLPIHVVQQLAGHSDIKTTQLRST